ncbi:MAG: dihydropteroate synthase, partial [Acutalibacteraceae bacterium]
DYILKQALNQVSDGAEILDVNVGLPEIDEKEMMVKVIKAIQSVTDAPLQLDSTDPKVLSAGLRVYNGKPIINSVNGEQKSLDAILPLAKKYGASVVGLALDEEGIPKTKEKRIEIAGKIFDNAEKHGIDKKEIFIDCLTLTVSAEQSQAVKTLEAMREITNIHGVKTVLGVSNISFGLPCRERVNSAFLTLALENGLTLPIINPSDPMMKGAFYSYKVLKGMDENSERFIEAFSGEEEQNKSKKQNLINKNSSAQPFGKESSEQSLGTNFSEKNAQILGIPEQEEGNDLIGAIIKGLKGDAPKITQQLLEKSEPMEIVESFLVPALDKAGENFEKGVTFLPQLMGSATAAQKSFEVIRAHMASLGQVQKSDKKIVLATVKGDVHDIGKNIVKVLLENYGFSVFDLGKDVPPEKIVQLAEKEDVKLIGLSALMTTTLKSMEETITLVHKSEKLKDAKVMVGGAVLTASYAQKIGADFYCKDAKESADIAKKVLG